MRAGFGEGQAAAALFEQAQAVAVFQAFDMLGKCGLREAEDLGRAADAAFLGGEMEGADLLEINRYGLWIAAHQRICPMGFPGASLCHQFGAAAVARTSVP